MANTYLTRTFGSSPSTTLFTWSAWVKRTKLGTQQTMISGCSSHGANTGQLIYFTDDDKLAYYAQASGTVKCNLKTNAKFRDTNAWYHIVLKVDSSQSNVANRVVFYVNNVERSYTTTVAHVQNWDAYFMLTTPTDVGRNGMNTSDYFDGVMSHMHMTHGYNYTPSTFGETDSTTGEWKIKTSPTVNYNSNGFFILKDGNTGTDHSGNSETFSVAGGTLTKTEDNPSNVFCTWNPLSKHPSCGHTYAHGNTKITMTTSRGSTAGTLGIPNDNGKFYWEMKCTTMPQDERFELGIQPFSNVEANDSTNANNKGLGLSLFNSVLMYAGSILNNFYGNNTTRFDGFTGIIGCAVDMTSATKTIAFSKDGAWISGSGTTDASFSNALKVDITSSVDDYSHWMPMAGSGNGSGTGGVLNTNFGNGYFGTTAVSSAGTNASDNGIFEYDVPTGYTALSTKGLNL